MKVFIFLAAIVAACFAKPATLLKESEIIDFVNNPRYLINEVETGLFSLEDLEAAPPNNTLSVEEDDITFYVYTPERPQNANPIKKSQLRDIVRLTGFNVQRETLVVIHGWTNNFESPVNDKIKTAALSSNRINVIVVDWSPIASRSYITAQGSVVAVGNIVGDFLISLDQELGHRLTKVTIVGHSLGAHISGNAGARANGLITTIVGLDPAGPLFSKNNINNRLDPTDAQNVHVIHTNDGLLGFGIRMGHADYYPNGGKSQPGCALDITGSCSHGRAFAYFAESFSNDNFVSKICDSYSNYENGRCNSNAASNMGGYPVDVVNDGEYFLKTNSKSPFALG